jgi:hypothetical protein
MYLHLETILPRYMKKKYIKEKKKSDGWIYGFLYYCQDSWGHMRDLSYKDPNEYNIGAWLENPITNFRHKRSVKMQDIELGIKTRRKRCLSNYKDGYHCFFHQLSPAEILSSDMGIGDWAFLRAKPSWINAIGFNFNLNPIANIDDEKNKLIFVANKVEILELGR